MKKTQSHSPHVHSVFPLIFLNVEIAFIAPLFSVIPLFSFLHLSKPPISLSCFYRIKESKKAER